MGLTDLIIPGASTLLGIAGSAFGMSQANKAAKKAESYNTMRMQQADNFFRENYYKDYMESDIARGTLEKLSKRFREQNDANANSATSGGSTPEAVLATAGQTQDSLNNATLSLAGAGQQWKDNIQSRYQNMLIPLQNNQQSILQGKVDQWNNFQDSIGSTSAGLLNAWAYGGFDKKKGAVKDFSGTPGGAAESEPIWNT